MSNFNMINPSKQQSSICPANGRQTVGDGAFTSDMTPSVLAVCHMEGTDSMYYYSTTFSGGPGWHWVTASLAPVFSSSPSSDRSSTLSSSSFGAESFPDSIVYPPTPPLDHSYADGNVIPFTNSVASAPRAILKNAPASDLLTPPLTPDDVEGGEGSVQAISAKQSKAALDFLSALFPRNGLGALQYAKSVSISSPDLDAVFDGVLLELPGKPKTFYVDGKNAQHVNLRESIVALMDLADEQLGCSALVIALEKSSPVLGDLLHSLMYVGGQVVTKPPFQVDPAYVLVGLEI
ncbi:Ornithine decarboxylase antizyme [Abortiporus biennis]